MSRREEGKADRRRRIIAAARELIRETGDAGLSMRAIAARAKVSLATPYNLFGSKRGIVLAVLEDVREFHERFSRLRAQDSLERFFQAVTMSIEYYVVDPDFYRTLWAAVFDTSGKEVRTAIITPQSNAFWRGLMAEAAREGVFLPGIDLELLQQSLGMSSSAAMLNWALGDLATAALEPTVNHSHALTLRGAATPEAARRLEATILQHQERLRVLREGASAA